MKINLRIILRTTVITVLTIWLILFVLFTLSINLPWQKTVDSDLILIPTSVIADAIREERLQNVEIELPNEIRKLQTKAVLDVNVKIMKQSFREWLAGAPMYYTVEYKWNRDQLKSILSSWKTESISAHFGFERWMDEFEHRDNLVIIPEINGNNYKVSKLARKIISSITKQEFSVNAKSLCQPPKITTSMLEPWYERIKWINDVCIKYSKGYKVDVDAKYLYSKLSSGLLYDASTIDLSDMLELVNSHYGTKDQSLDFTDSSGTMRTVHYNTYGRYVNVDKEEEVLRDLINNRAVIYDHEPAMRGYDDFQSTYLEVSIDQQHVWHYNAGKLCCESSIVTGRKARHDTPIGVFYISERIPGKYLVGEGYKTWVNKWMRLNNNGIGLHDAYWRGNFGKQVYVYNGSHGCINLPKVYAYKLYEETYVGMPVVVY